SDEPVIAAPGARFDRLAENVGEGLVQGARFILVFEVGCLFRYSVRHFMRHEIERAGPRIRVAKSDVTSVPERVVVTGPVAHHAEDRPTVAIERIALVALKVVVIDLGETVGSTHGIRQPT